MTQLIVTMTLWFCAIGAGLMAGVYFAFSSFIMASLARIAPAEGVAAMQSINRVILRSLFLPLFFGTTAASLGLAVFGALRWSEPGAPAMLAGGIVYVVGMFVCTAVFNVPLNNALAAVDAARAEATGIWPRYLRVWTFWNHVRTAACAIACGLFIGAIAAT